MVQVWALDAVKGNKEGEPLAYGLVIGDGTQILTVIDYEQDIPKDLYVGLPGKTRYRASIQAIDVDNSATLLKMEKRVFPPAVIPEKTGYQWGSWVIIHGWALENFREMETREVSFFQPGNFGQMRDTAASYNDALGAVVANKGGQIIGLMGVSYTAGYPFSIILGGPGMTGPMLDIHDALKVLSPDSLERSWANQPVFAFGLSISGGQAGKPFATWGTQYEKTAAALLQLLGAVGAPLAQTALPSNFLSFVFDVPQNIDSVVFAAVYPQPVNLVNVSGEVVAHSRWLGIQFDRGDGQPNRIFYGHFGNYSSFEVDGGYILNGDISALEASLYSLVH
jgi:hypothetical protein